MYTNGPISVYFRSLQATFYRKTTGFKPAFSEQKASTLTSRPAPNHYPAVPKCFYFAWKRILRDWISRCLPTRYKTNRSWRPNLSRCKLFKTIETIVYVTSVSMHQNKDQHLKPQVRAESVAGIFTVLQSRSQQQLSQGARNNGFAIFFQLNHSTNLFFFQIGPIVCPLVRETPLSAATHQTPSSS